MDLRSTQAPLKTRYRDEPEAAQITLTADGGGRRADLLLGRPGPRGTLGLARDVPAGFGAIRLAIEVDAPEATDEQLAKLGEKTERYCTVAQTLMQPAPLAVEVWCAGS